MGKIHFVVEIVAIPKGIIQQTEQLTVRGKEACLLFVKNGSERKNLRAFKSYS